MPTEWSSSESEPAPSPTRKAEQNDVPEEALDVKSLRRAVRSVWLTGMVPTRLANLCFDANDPVRLAMFWASALGWEIYEEAHDEIGVLPTDGTRFIPWVVLADPDGNEFCVPRPQ